MTVDERESLVNDLCMGFMTLGADMAELKNMLYVILEPYEITTRSTAVAEVTLELPDLEDTTGPARCITGQSGSGICGAAAYCDQPYDCCAQCDEDCNGRCGWIPRTERTETEEVATPQEKVVYANRAYIKAPPYHLPKFDLKEALGYLREKEQELGDFVSAGNIPEKTITRMKMTVEGLKLLAALTLAPIAEDVQNE